MSVHPSILQKGGARAPVHPPLATDLPLPIPIPIPGVVANIDKQYTS